MRGFDWIDSDLKSTMYDLERHELEKQEREKTGCILGKCRSPELCNDFSACDARLVRDSVTKHKPANA